MPAARDEGFEPPAAVGEIRRALLARPELDGWRDLRRLVERAVREGSLPCWDWCLLASRAAGGTDEDALPAATAVFSLFYAVHLVDDLLDEDPRGAQRELGEGPVANMASCLQGLAAVGLDAAALDDRSSARAQALLGRVAAETARGQHLDALGADDEDGYWRIVRAKTPPLFAGALELGALCGGAPPDAARRVGALGEDLGLLVQVSDDLADALARPASVDWRRPGTNLAILYAREAEHGERDRFRRLLTEASGEPDGLEVPGQLEELQSILLRSGAVSYGVYCMVEHSRAARSALGRLDLPDAEPLRYLIRRLGRPVASLLERVGAEVPEEL